MATPMCSICQIASDGSRHAVLLVASRREALTHRRRGLDAPTSEHVAAWRKFLGRRKIGTDFSYSRADPQEGPMLDRFTARARRSIVLATEEARSRRHESISPEHLLVGILRDGDGMAVKVLERLQVPSEMLRADVEHLLDGVPRSSMRPEPVFSPELRAVLQAAVEARQQQSRLIG